LKRIKPFNQEDPLLTEGKGSQNSSLEDIEVEGSFDINNLLNLLQENQICQFSCHLFSLEHLIYRHRQQVYKGNLEIENKNFEVYIKKYSLNSRKELDIILNELEIILYISEKKNSAVSVNKNLNSLLGVSIDRDDNYFYTIYEYLPYESTNLSCNLITMNYFQKLIVLKNLLKFTLDLHSLGIIHRDLRLEHFFIDQRFNLKIFDFSNAIHLQTNLIKMNEIKELKDVKDMREIENIPTQINYKFSTPYLTAKYAAPEVTMCRPREGWAQDIWSLGCMLIELLIDYKKYEEGTIEVLLNKIFRGENSQVPRIPKDLEQNVALILAKCFYVEPVARLDTLQLIEKFNRYFKKNHFEILDITPEQKSLFTPVKEVYRQNYIVQYFKFKYERENPKEIEFCRYNHNKRNSFYCETCDNFFCEYCIIQTHAHHTYADITIDFDIKKKVVEMLGIDLEEKFCETNFFLIDEFRNTFNNDYEEEEKRIKNQYDEIRKKIDVLEKLELGNLKKSRQIFLDKKFKKIFEESDKVAEYYKTFYYCKDQFFSHFNRFKNTLSNFEVSIDQVRTFNKKFNKFNEFAEILKSNGDNLISKCSSLRIPGKYIFRHEHYTDEVLKYLKAIENKIYIEKHKYFDYSGNDSLFLTQELLMIIPLTNCVFSYIKNSYKKIQANFEINKVKIKSFLPGCATLHIGNNFYVTGGEIKDEPTSEFIWMNIDEKVVEEAAEMNYSRRYHTMIALNKKYICVVGGWNSNEVEIIDVDNLDYWRVLPSMHYVRSDPTVYFFNGNYIYVMGGWDYTKKNCVGDVERYEIFDADGNIRFNKQWEIIKIKNNPVYLKKYNMGLIALNEENNEHSEKILLVGGFDEEYDYSPSVIKLEIMTREPAIFVNKDIKGLPTDGESSFWYEKNFHLMYNDFENEPIAVNFNCFNNIYVYSLRKNEFKLYTNSTQNQTK
jgi:serine/threonine protein kinase